MGDNYMLTAAIGCLILVGTVVHSASIYDLLMNEDEHGLLNYNTDFWPNSLPDPWNESLF